MRQKIALLTLSFFASTVVLAQSTCQTRVDAHQKATTLQRVEYCLTPEEYPAVTVSNPELVYAQVSSHEPAPTPKQKEYTSSNPYFDEGKYTIMQGYVDTTQFPQFQNATMSEQELAAQRKAWLEREATLNQAQAPLVVRTKPTVVMESTSTRSTVTTKPTVIISETKSGLTYRSHKPNRVMKQKGLVEETTVTSSTTTTSVETDLSGTQKTTEETLPQTSTTQTSTTQTSTTQTTASLPEEKPSEDELGIPMNNPYAQPADLTNTDETTPYGEK